MARNGSGTYVRTNGVNTGSTTWTTDRNQGAAILAGRHDTHDQDIADALTQSISADGQTTVTANLPMSTFRHTGVGAGVGRTDYARLDQVQDASVAWGGNSSGAANVFACSLTPAISAYVGGLRLAFVAHQNSTSTATLNVNGVGAIALVTSEGFALTPYAIRSGQIVEVIYNSSSFYIQNPTTIQLPYQTLAATGTTQGTAAAIQSSMCVVTSATAGANDGVILPAAKRGASIRVALSTSPVSVKIYPASGEYIAVSPAIGPTVNASITADPTTTFMYAFFCKTDGTWFYDAI